MDFEWDENKNQINQKKHGISFEDAKTVFEDELAILFDDPDHSAEEDRFLIIGMSRTEKICIVSHCYQLSSIYKDTRGLKEEENLFGLTRM